MDIKRYYKFMIENIPEFKAFHDEHENVSIEELIRMYNIENKRQD